VAASAKKAGGAGGRKRKAEYVEVSEEAESQGVKKTRKKG